MLHNNQIFLFSFLFLICAIISWLHAFKQAKCLRKINCLFIFMRDVSRNKCMVMSLTESVQLKSRDEVESSIVVQCYEISLNNKNVTLKSLY